MTFRPADCSSELGKQSGAKPQNRCPEAWAADKRIAEVMQRQYGVATLDQAVAAGLTYEHVRALLRAGRWLRLHQGVFAAANWPPSDEQRLVAACLATGGYASHRAAAWLWDLRDESEIEVTVARGHAPKPEGVIIHRPLKGTRPPSFRRNIAVTDPLRALADLGSVVPKEEVLDALVRARAKKLVTVKAVAAERDRLAQRGRAGIGALRWALEQVAPDNGRTPSVLEAKAFRLWRSAGLPDPVCEQHVLADGDFYLDCDWAEAAYTVELDGWSSRASATSLAESNRRQNKIVDTGRLIHRFCWDDIVKRGRETAAYVARTYWARRHELGKLTGA